jgi:hypothetical protein
LFTSNLSKAFLAIKVDLSPSGVARHSLQFGVHLAKSVGALAVSMSKASSWPEFIAAFI